MIYAQLSTRRETKCCQTPHKSAVLYGVHGLVKMPTVALIRLTLLELLVSSAVGSMKKTLYNQRQICNVQKKDR